MNTRFAVATHLLSFLSSAEGLVTSEEAAVSINTHPALVRRMLSILREAGLVETQLGPGGGARLARPASAISLLDVYDAIDEDNDLFAVGRLSPNPDCPVGANIRKTLECLLAGPETALREALRKLSIRQVCMQALATAGQPAAAARTDSAA